MIITIKAELLPQQEPGTVRIMTNVESFKEALNQHSPNILVDYLNEQWQLRIARINRKEATNGTADR